MDGSVSVWGDSTYGGSNAPTSVTAPAPGAEVITIASSNRAFDALKADGSVFAWGSWGGGAPKSVTNPAPGAEVIWIEAGYCASAALQKIPYPAGRYENVEGLCADCPAGTYAENKGSSMCTPCPAGRASSETAAISSNVHTLCSPGSFAVEGSDICMPCPPGTYAEVDELGACTPCPAGSYSDNTGAGNSTTCQLCTVGTYSEIEGANSSDVCIKCPGGTYSNSTHYNNC